MKPKPRHADTDAVIAHMRKMGLTSREAVLRAMQKPSKLRAIKGTEDAHGIALNWLLALDWQDWKRLTGLRWGDPTG